MTTFFKQPGVDRLYAVGCGLIVVSLFFFSLPLFLHLQEVNYFGLFIANFVIAAVYFVLLWTNGRLRRGRNGLPSLFLFLILFLISAYALNREMIVFEDTVPWFATLLVLACTNYVAFTFFERFPGWLRHAMCFILGISMLAFAYLSIYLFPLYLVGAVGFFLLGISLHTFVPLLFCIYTIVLMNKKTVDNKRYWFGFYGGMATTLAVTIFFVAQWSNITGDINRIYRKAQAYGENGLPGWVAAAQQLPQNWISERVLKADLVYTVPDEHMQDMFWRMPSRNFDEQRKHDPLVTVAVLFAGRPNLSEENRIQILESLFDSRHQAQERLWSGNDLYTEHVKTSVRMWPQLAMSYTEKQITVTNASRRSGWRGDQQEAIYTFHLPEGSVVTALSLWIAGIEAKGILTTKEKADSAYRTIVGVEARDPSLVHWQEGNTVSVRVFPVIAGESRIFKIGITTPLSKRDDKLVYENVHFDGPSTSNTTEDVSIDFAKSPTGIIQPALFSSENGQSFTSSGPYEADWSMAVDAEPISGETFSFNGKTYTVRPYQQQRTDATFNTIYLDVNSSWTHEEFMKLFDLLREKAIYVYNNGLTLVNEQNKEALFARLNANRFSLFPLHVIADPGSSLLVSKSSAASPNLSDLKESRFYEGLKACLQQQTKIKLFNIGFELSPYLKSLKEYRVFNYEEGTVSELAKLVADKKFAQDIENDQRVVIDNAGITILQSEGETPSAAPDHLFRLFAYNHIM
ncbi:MAG TPA: XrtN system VIT domain-containing protein, partial [Chitinophagaceae bacterium]|nr:XrtN system VIT domain-containing protein [Chitinophagaceae bacterium]